MQSKHTPPDIRYTEQAETGGPCRHHPAQTPEAVGGRMERLATEDVSLCVVQFLFLFFIILSRHCR